MAFLPFSSGFEHDYDYDAVEIAKETEVTEDDVLALNELRMDHIKKIHAHQDSSTESSIHIAVVHRVKIFL